MKRILFYTAACLLLIPWAATGQRSIDLEEIQVIAPFVPSIADAYKINTQPAMDDTLEVRIQADVRILPQKLISVYSPEPMAPARLRGEPLLPVSRGFLRGSGGNYASSHASGALYSLRSDRRLLGMDFRHEASAREMETGGYGQFSDNHLRLFGRRFFERHFLDVRLMYARNLRHFNELPDTLTLPLPLPPPAPSSDDYLQRFDRTSAQLLFGNHRPLRNNLDYRFSLNHRFIRDQFNASEHRFSMQGVTRIHHQARIGRLELQPYLEGLLDADLFDQQMPAASSMTGLLSLKPRLGIDGKRIQIHAGLNATIQYDTLTYIRIYPQAGFTWHLAEDWLSLYASLSGGMEKYGLYDLSLNNPFMVTDAALPFKNIRLEAGGGIRGRLTRHLSYQFSAHYAEIDQASFFVNAIRTAPINRFEMVFDDISKWRFSGLLDLDINRKFNLRLEADYYEYTLESQAAAWHTPSFTASAQLRYVFREKLRVTADVFVLDEFQGRRLGPPGPMTPETVQGVSADLNLGLAYRYLPSLTFFVDAYNLSNRNHYLWMYLPSQGLRIMAGVHYTF